MTLEIETPPLRHLKILRKQYKNILPMVNGFLSNRRNGSLIDWPKWCFLPMAGWHAIVTAHSKPVHNLGAVAAIGTWNYTQGIYKFDQDLKIALGETRLTGNIPGLVLLRLPEWCVYIDAEGLTWSGKELHGFWVHLEWDANTERHELRFLFNAKGTSAKALFPMPIHIGEWSLSDGITRMIDEARLQAQKANIEIPVEYSDVALLAKELHPILAMVLFICSDKPGFDLCHADRPRPTLKRIKQSHEWQLIPAQKPIVWMIGEKMGQAIRHNKIQSGNAKKESPSSHIRRGHWHGYWTGHGNQKQFKYHWLAATIVRGREPVNQTPK